MRVCVAKDLDNRLTDKVFLYIPCLHKRNVCLVRMCVAKDLANRLTDMIHLFSEVFIELEKFNFNLWKG